MLVLLFSGPRDPLINRLAPDKAFFRPMPVGDIGFAKLPTEQDDLSIDATGKIKQSDVEILKLDAGCIDFCDCVLDLLHSFLALSLAPGQVDHVEQHAAFQ